MAVRLKRQEELKHFNITDGVRGQNSTGDVILETDRQTTPFGLHTIPDELVNVQPDTN